MASKTPSSQGEAAPHLQPVKQVVIWMLIGLFAGLLIAGGLSVKWPNLAQRTYALEVDSLDPVLRRIGHAMHDGIAGYAQRQAISAERRASLAAEQRVAADKQGTLEDFSTYINRKFGYMVGAKGWRLCEQVIAPMVSYAALRYAFLAVLVFASIPMFKAAWGYGRSASLASMHDGKVATDRDRDYRYNEWKYGIAVSSAAAIAPYAVISGWIVMPILFAGLAFLTYKMRATMAASI